MGFDVTQILDFWDLIGLMGAFLLFMIMRKGWDGLSLLQLLFLLCW